MTGEESSARPSTIVFVGAHADYMYRFRLPLMEHFALRGYRVVVVSTAFGGFDPALFAQAGFDYVEWPMKRAGLDPIADLFELHVLWRVFRRERPQIVFAHTVKPVIYGILLAWLAGVPRRVAMIPGLGFAFIGARGFKRRFTSLAGRLGYRLALHRADVVIFQNPDDRQALTDLGALGRDAPTALVNGSGVDLERFVAAPLPPGPPVFLMIARLMRDKGVYEFVEAARRVKSVMPGTRFVLVGAGDPHNPASVAPAQIAAWVADGIIEARGHVEDPRTELAACHAFVLPSYREGTPRTNLEAMATARAVITTDVPGCRETVTHGINGLLVPVRDPLALADAMLMLARDPQLFETMGRAGLRRCSERYELRTVTGITAAIIAGAPPPANRAISPERRG